MVKVNSVSNVALEPFKRKYDKNSSFSGVESKKFPKNRRKSLGTVLPTPAKPKIVVNQNGWSVAVEKRVQVTPKKRRKSAIFVKDENFGISTALSTPKSVKKAKKPLLLPAVSVKKETSEKVEVASIETLTKVSSEGRKKVKTEELSKIKIDYEDLEKRFNIKAKDIEKAVEGIIKLRSENPKLQNELLEENAPLFLQISCHHIPNGYPRIIRIPVPNPILTSDDEVCLIVSDIKNIKNIEHEQHLEHYEELLRNKGVENIKKIMTFHEFRTEYETFEQKRQLVNLYDLFLVDAKISGKVVKKCGKIFYKNRKVPMPIKLQVSKLKEHIDKSLRKVFFYLHLKGNSHIVQFGHSKMDVCSLTENVFALIEGLSQEFPGGFENFKGIQVYATRASSIPIYISMKSPNEVKIPKVESKKPKAYKTVTGELSTRLNANVTVKASGQVIVKKITMEGDGRKGGRKKKRANRNKKIEQNEFSKNGSNVVKQIVKDADNNNQGPVKVKKEKATETGNQPGIKAEKRHIQPLGSGEEPVNKKKKPEMEEVGLQEAAEEKGNIVTISKEMKNKALSNKQKKNTVKKEALKE